MEQELPEKLFYITAEEKGGYTAVAYGINISVDFWLKKEYFFDQDSYSQIAKLEWTEGMVELLMLKKDPSEDNEYTLYELEIRTFNDSLSIGIQDILK